MEIGVEIGLNDHAAVEAGDRFGDFQRLDQHLHAPRRPPAGNPKQDAGIVQLLHRLDGARGENFVLRDQRAIDVGDDQTNAKILRVGLRAHSGLLFLLGFGYRPGLLCMMPPSAKMVVAVM